MPSTPVVVLDSTLTDIADAIRGKNGSSDTYKPSEMPAAITAVPSGGGGDNNWADVMRGDSTSLYDNSVTELPDYRLGGYSSGTWIEEVSFPEITKIGSYAFTSQTKLEHISIPKLTHLGSFNVFYGCSALTELTLPNLVDGVGGNPAHVLGKTFMGATAIKKIDLGKYSNTTSIGFSTDFCRNCSGLQALILRWNSVIPAYTAMSNIFSGSGIASGIGYIYVPSSLVASYQSANNWSAYSAKFRAIESYSTDGTVNGDIIVT